jgi:hypothetical protein
MRVDGRREHYRSRRFIVVKVWGCGSCGLLRVWLKVLEGIRLHLFDTRDVDYSGTKESQSDSYCLSHQGDEVDGQKVWTVQAGQQALTSPDTICYAVAIRYPVCCPQIIESCCRLLEKRPPGRLTVGQASPRSSCPCLSGHRANEKEEVIVFRISHYICISLLSLSFSLIE